jgi:anti-sigma factor RsiW
MRDQIADFVTGILPEEEAQTLQQHLSECAACRDYAQRLEEEEQLLTGFFAKFDTNMASWEDEAINMINRFDASGRNNVISVGKMIMRSFLIRHAAVAAVIVFVTLYFIITLTYISQINECIRLCM